MPPLKLLVVEDDIPSLELMEEVFISLKADVCPVNDSQQAAVLVNREKFDGIFLDLEMPNLHGFELAQKVRKSSWNKSTPIVIVTGRENRDTMHQSFLVGATFYLQKPVDRQKLTGLFRTIRGTLIENRRRYTRVPLQTSVTCTQESRVLRGQTWNLSQGGMQVDAGSLVPGETVRVSFQIPNSPDIIEAVGTVVWAKTERQGIQFTNLNSPQREQICDFIAQMDKSDELMLPANS